MILVDTSVWIDHLRLRDETLVRLLDSSQVLYHPFVIGELACGTMSRRDRILALLANLPPAAVASHAEVLVFIKQHQLMGRGIGYVDCHLLAAVALGSPAKLWTRDKRLASVAADLYLECAE